MASVEIDLSVPSLTGLHERRGAKWASVAPDVLSMTIAEMDFPVAPAIREAVKQVIDRSDFGYGLPPSPTLRSAVTGFARRRFGWEIDDDRISIVPDVMLGIVGLGQLIAGPGGSIGFATPAYPPFFRELALAGLTTVAVDLDSDGSISLADLDRALDEGIRAFMLANPHNPTGRALPRAELEAVASRCADRGVWVLADEIHAPLVLPGAAHVPWLEVSDAARRWGIALTSASKAFNLAALKTALIVTASDEAQGVVERLGPQHDHGSLLGQVALEVAFTECDDWLDAVLTQLDANRSTLADALQTVRFTPPHATYLAWLDCRALGLGDDPAHVFLERGRVALAPGLNYGTPGAGHVRLNFATSPEHLVDGIDRMVAALTPAQRAGSRV